MSRPGRVLKWTLVIQADGHGVVMTQGEAARRFAFGGGKNAMIRMHVYGEKNRFIGISRPRPSANAPINAYFSEAMTKNPFIASCLYALAGGEPPRGTWLVNFLGIRTPGQSPENVWRQDQPVWGSPCRSAREAIGILERHVRMCNNGMTKHRAFIANAMLTSAVSATTLLALGDNKAMRVTKLAHWWNVCSGCGLGQSMDYDICCRTCALDRYCSKQCRDVDAAAGCSNTDKWSVVRFEPQPCVGPLCIRAKCVQMANFCCDTETCQFGYCSEACRLADLSRHEHYCAAKHPNLKKDAVAELAIAWRRRGAMSPKQWKRYRQQKNKQQRQRLDGSAQPDAVVTLAPPTECFMCLVGEEEESGVALKPVPCQSDHPGSVVCGSCWGGWSARNRSCPLCRRDL